MITTTWQEAGFPDIHNVDYGVPMFVLSNAELEYNYIRGVRYSEENRESYLHNNCQKHLNPKDKNLWGWYHVKLNIVDNFWDTHYLFLHGAGSFDLASVSKEAVIRDWTATQTGPLIVGQVSNLFTNYFLAEAARQVYMILSGYVYYNFPVSTLWYADYVTINFDADSVNWFNSMFINPDFYVGYKRGIQPNYTGKIASGSQSDFSLNELQSASAFGIVRGIPKNSYWVGKRLQG